MCLTCGPRGVTQRAPAAQVWRCVVESINGEKVRSPAHGAMLLTSVVGEVGIIVNRKVPSAMEMKMCA